MAKILAIDEYPSIRDLLSEELTEEGNVVLSSGDPNLIPEMLRTFEPDLMIIDPYMHGGMHWELLERIKKQKPHMPILVFVDPSKKEPRQLQVAAWVAKSFLFDDLKQKINDILGKPSWKPAQFTKF